MVVGAAFLMSELTHLDAYPRNPTMLKFVSCGDGLRSFFGDVDRLLEPGDRLVAVRDRLSQSFAAYSARAGIDVDVLRPVDTMLEQMGRGGLRRYIAERWLWLSRRESTVLLIPPLPPGSQAELDIRRIFGRDGFGFAPPIELGLIRTWDTRALPLAVPSLALYRLR